MSADKHRGIRREKQKRAKDLKKRAHQPQPAAAQRRATPQTAVPQKAE